MEKGFKSNGKFDIRSNKYFPGMSGEWNFESADSIIEVLGALPSTINQTARGLMDTFFEGEERQIKLSERREKAYEHEMLEAANAKIAALEEELAKMKGQAAEKDDAAKKEFPSMFEKPRE